MDFLADVVSPSNALRETFLCLVLIVLFVFTRVRKQNSTLPWVALDEAPTTKGIQNIGKARRQWVENCNAVIDKGLKEVSPTSMHQTIRHRFPWQLYTQRLN